MPCVHRKSPHIWYSHLLPTTFVTHVGLCSTCEDVASHGSPQACARATLLLRASEDSVTHLLPLQEEAAANEAVRQAARLVQERQQAVTDADGRIKELQGHLQRLQAQQSELSMSAALLVVCVLGCRVALNMQHVLFGSELSTPVALSYGQFQCQTCVFGLLVQVCHCCLVVQVWAHAHVTLPFACL